MSHEKDNEQKKEIQRTLRVKTQSRKRNDQKIAINGIASGVEFKEESCGQQLQMQKEVQ